MKNFALSLALIMRFTATRKWPIVSRPHFYNSDVGFSQLECRKFTTRMSEFHNSDDGFLQLGCRILRTRTSDFYNSDLGFSQVRCRIFKLKTSMSDFQQLRWHL